MKNLTLKQLLSLVAVCGLSLGGVNAVNEKHKAAKKQAKHSAAAATAGGAALKQGATQQVKAGKKRVLRKRGKSARAPKGKGAGARVRKVVKGKGKDKAVNKQNRAASVQKGAALEREQKRTHKPASSQDRGGLRPGKGAKAARGLAGTHRIEDENNDVESNKYNTDN